MRVSDLQAALLRHRPQIVHFSGHGRGERISSAPRSDVTREMLPAHEQDEDPTAGEILVENDAGRAEPIPAAALANLFGILGDVRCVVLNACHSAAQAEAIRPHVDAVIGMSQSIQDAAAINFAWAFYQGLAFGESVHKAFDLGRNQIDLAGLGDGKVPKLLTRQSAMDARVFLADSTVPASTRDTALRVPIDERVLAILDLAKRDMERQNLRFLTPSLLLVLLGLHRPVSCFERVRPGLSTLLRNRLIHYVTQKLPGEGMSFVPFAWGDLDQVKKAQEAARLDRCPMITDKHLLLGVIESGGSTMRSLQSILGEDFSQLVQVIRHLPAVADGPLLHTPGIELE
ncbi:CHAT domain-containing protein [Polyangium sp. 6x1]|nr:CHAT domain-containing protein [Polyangium sp. 6x1]MDI1442460.1 CHAT domain-containing protein [Polyangium sp. 6x1]